MQANLKQFHKMETTEKQTQENEYFFAQKKSIQKFRKYILGEDLKGVSIQENYIPKEGDYIAESGEDIWIVSREFFEENYVVINSEKEEIERLEFGGCFELVVNRTRKEHIYTIKGETSGFLFDQEKRKNGAKIGNFLRNKQ